MGCLKVEVRTAIAGPARMPGQNLRQLHSLVGYAAWRRKYGAAHGGIAASSSGGPRNALGQPRAAPRPTYISLR
jgi:hypothetical protein